MVIMFNPAPSTALLTKVREYRGKRKSKRSTLPARTPRRTHHQQPQRNPFPGSTSPKGGATAENDRHLSPPPSPPAATSPQDKLARFSARTAGPPPTSRGTHHQQPPRHPFQGLTPSWVQQRLTTTTISVDPHTRPCPSAHVCPSSLPVTKVSWSVGAAQGTSTWKIALTETRHTCSRPLARPRHPIRAMVLAALKRARVKYPKQRAKSLNRNVHCARDNYRNGA